MTSNTKRIALSAVVIAGLLVALLFLLKRPADPSRSTASGPTSANPGDNSMPSLATTDAGPGEIIEGKPPTGPEEIIPWARMEESKNDYLKFAVFPPWSRPYDGSVAHILTWNVPSETGQAFALDENKGPISADVSMDRWFAGPGESLTVKVKVWRGEHDAKGGASIPFTVEGTVSTSGSMPEAVGGDDSLMKLDFAKREGDSELEQSVTFVPSKIPGLAEKQNDASVWMWVTAGDRRFPFQLTFRYASEKTTPLVILGYQGDRIEKGSLIASIEADVKLADQIQVRAGLYEVASNTPIAVFDGWHQATKTGRQTIRIEFFGKILHDAGKDGPYEIRNLNGIAHVDNGELILDVGWSSPKTFRTTAYRASEFSDAEWDDEEKQEKIRRYDEEIGRLKAAGNHDSPTPSHEEPQ